MKNLIAAFVLFAGLALAQSPFDGTTYIKSYAGVPTAADCTATRIGWRAINTATSPDTVYTCKESAAAPAWVADGGSSTITDSRVYKAISCARDGVSIWSQWNALADAGGPFPQCSGIPQVEGFANFAATGTNQTAYFAVELPSTWTSTIDLDLLYANFGVGTAGTADQIKWLVSTKCLATGVTYDSPTFNPAQSVTGTASSTTNRVKIKSTIVGLTTTGCVAGDTMIVQVTRDNTVANNYAAQAMMVKSVVRVQHN